VNTTVILVLDRRRVKKGDLYPICLLLNHKGTKLYLNLKDSVATKFWDQQNQKVLNGAPVSPNVSWVNNHVQGKKTDAIRLISLLEQTGELAQLSPMELKQRIRNKSHRASFYGYLDSLIAQFNNHGKQGNGEVYLRTKVFLQNYVPGKKDLFFDEINFKLLKSIELHYLAKGNHLNGLSHYFRTIRAIYNRGITEGIVKSDAYPFKEYKIKQVKTHKSALRKDDLMKLWDISITEGTLSWHARNMFFFSFYCQGMNFSDLAKLKIENIKVGRIYYTRSKISKAMSIKLTDKINEILEKYVSGKKRSDYVFPIITEESRHNLQIKNYRDAANHALKRWAKKLTLNPSLSFNTARHSWATIGKDMQLPIGVLSEGLGHNDQRTTQIYLDSFESDVIDGANDLITSS